MDNNLHNDNDGLEDFFHDRLFGYQDEPGLDMWDRIENQIPEKPKTDYKPVFIWASRAIAACLILSLGFFNFQYRSQLDHVAIQLKDSKDNMASLEERINAFQQSSQQTIENPIAALVDNNINTNPTIQKTTPQTQIIYLPMQTDEAEAMVASEKYIPYQKTETKEILIASPKTQQHTIVKKDSPSKKRGLSMPSMAFASNHFNIESPKDILNLKKKIVTRKNPIFVNQRKLKVPASQLRMKKGKWGMGNDNSGVVTNMPIAAKSQKKSFKDKAIEDVMQTWVSSGNRLSQAEKEINWDNVIGIGANYSINNNISLFLGPDYWEASKKPRMLSNNNLYPYSVGLESGVTYHF